MAHYPFNGNINDETGNYPPLSIYGALPTNDRFGNPNSAYSFDGVNDWMSGPSYDVINPLALSSFCISFWFSTSRTWAPGNNPNTMLVGNIVTAEENIVYDNGTDQAIGGGSIVIHTK